MHEGMHRHVRREIAEQEFEYGNHVITVSIRVEYTNQYNGQHDILNGIEGYHYYRFVRVDARPEDDPDGMPEVSHSASVALDDDGGKDYRRRKPFPLRVMDALFSIGDDGKDRTPGVPGIPDHVEHTVDRVVGELDQMYEYTARDVDVEVDVAMDRVEAETSWVDVGEDEFAGEVGRELDEVAEEPDVKELDS